MKLILEDDFGNKIRLKEKNIDTWVEYSRVFLRALKALEFHIPEEYDKFLDDEDEKLELRMKEIIGKFKEK